jgi:RHS repeat-associated protein
MVNQQTYNFTYDAENHLIAVSGAAQEQFTYNGDGQRVVATEGITKTVFIGNYFEWQIVANGEFTTTQTTKNYYAGGTRVAMQRGGEGTKYLLGDHLGSASVVLNADGTALGAQGYLPWGEVNFTEGTIDTEYTFNGQYDYSNFGLTYFNARWYDSSIGRFAQSDTIIPEASQGTQAWDRYAGLNNNPVRYSDPSGHNVDVGIGDSYYKTTKNVDGSTETCLYIGGVKQECTKTPAPTPPEPSVPIDPVVLDGGPGAGSYGALAEDTYTGFSTSGATEGGSPDIGFVNDFFVWVRDNTIVREAWLGATPDVSGQVYYEMTSMGFLVITGASITNSSYENIAIATISGTGFSTYGNAMIYNEMLYPSSSPIIVNPGYGIAAPGSTSGVVLLSSSPIASKQYIVVVIRVITPSGRWGITTGVVANP